MRQRAAEEAFELSGVRHVSALAFGPVYAGGGMLMYWTHRPQAPWQREDWLSEMRQALRPNQYHDREPLGVDRVELRGHGVVG